MDISSRKALAIPAALITLMLGVLASGPLLRAHAPILGKSEPFDAATGYRIAQFRAEVPSSVPGGRMIGIDALEELMAWEKPLLIDVVTNDTTLVERLRDMVRGPPAERQRILGSVWLPRMGLGRLDEAEAAAEKGKLLSLASGARDRPMVFYCLANCWVSWNAARRAVGFGFSRVLWYRDGIEAWMDAGLPVEASPAEPDLIPAWTQRMDISILRPLRQ